MTRAKISEYSATANDNTDVNGVNIAEGCPPSSMNNMGREIMAALKRFQVGSDGDGVTVGGALVVSGATTLTTVSATVVQSDTVSEKTSAAGVTIDGVLLKDNGVVTGAGTVSAPVYSTTGDTNTGIFFPAADTIAFAEGGAEAMRIDSSGNVGIGTSSPALITGISKEFSISDLGATGIVAVNLQGNRSSSGNTTGIIGFFNSTNRTSQITGLRGVGADDGLLTLSTASSGTLTERMRIDSSGNVGIGTSSPVRQLHINNSTAGQPATFQMSTANTGGTTGDGFTMSIDGTSSAVNIIQRESAALQFYTSDTERMRIDSSGNLLVGKTTGAGATVGAQIENNGIVASTVGSGAPLSLYANRQGDDGVLVSLRQANIEEGTISVSGTTVSYNGGHLSRWAQTTTAKDESLKKGTVLSNLDEMNVYVDADGNPVENEQLNKVKVSDVEGDANVAGVFVNWTYDEAHQVDEINMAMTGDMIIRIAQGTTVARGDLLMSAGDGTAKPQGDDIVRSKTIAKVTSTHVTCTYDDGSYCVPCVLMAC